jgi:hypothetical protein
LLLRTVNAVAARLGRSVLVVGKREPEAAGDRIRFHDPEP